MLTSGKVFAKAKEKHYIRIMCRVYSKNFFILALCLLQFSAPVIGITAELACKEKPARACETAPCCQQQNESRLTCCDQTAPAKSGSPAAAILNPARVYLDLFTPIPFAETGCDFKPAVRSDQTFSSFNSHLAGNQRYKLLATFLI